MCVSYVFVCARVCESVHLYKCACVCVHKYVQDSVGVKYFQPLLILFFETAFLTEP